MYVFEQSHPKAKKYRDHTLVLYIKLSDLFVGAVATGAAARASVEVGTVDEKTSEEDNLDVNPHAFVGFEEQEDSDDMPTLQVFLFLFLFSLVLIFQCL